MSLSARLELHRSFSSDHLPDARDVIVYLPPGYRRRGRTRYPVLYMHDGQNLFDPHTAYIPGHHWRVGETADHLIDTGRIAPLVIVGVYNAGPRRIAEYSPTKDKRHGGGMADAYGRLLVEDLKPYIDANYNTHRDAAHTGLGGSSMGGLVTLHLGLRHADVFSRLAAFSPSVWWDQRVILRTVARYKGAARPRVWLDMGTAEARYGLGDARLLRNALARAGWAEGDTLAYSEHEGARHSETAWAERVGPMLEFLFPKAGSGGVGQGRAG
jgi:predicted alpha/beta superfamily hydrolase